MIAVEEFKPSYWLQPYVVCFSKGYYNTAEKTGTSLQIVPNGCLELIIHLDDNHCNLQNDDTWSRTPSFMLIGLLTSSCEVRFNEKVHVFGIRFKADTLFSLFGVPGSLIVQGHEDISELLGRDFEEFCNRLRDFRTSNEMVRFTEQYLLGVWNNRMVGEDYVVRAARLLRNSDHIDIKSLSEKVAISQRQLERKFRNVIGISPKQYFRLLRINKVVQALQSGTALDLTSVAYHCGYYDQAHFIKDFKLITGIKPSLFSKGREDYIVIPA
ncbi:MAG: AraC family transcriptional regulator [Flavobacteriaceae bacterium]|nr:AraC family transcriptional regulator [Flavobacteriaceae bacterium]